MIGIGTIINVIFVILGTTLGLLLKKGIPERLKETVIKAIGLSTCFIGISGVVSKMIYVNDNSFETKNTMLLVVSLVIGGLAGELINIEKHLESFGEFCKKKIKIKGNNDSFVEAFVTASLLFCVGAMAIVGSLEDGLTGDYSTLFAKSVMDGIMSVMFAATMGVGVYLSALPVLVYQGSITLLAGVLKPFLSNVLIDQVSLVGSVLIFAIGINFLTNSKIRIGNLLPAVLVPIFYQIILNVLG